MSMCNNFVQQGHCRFGDRCTFKHGYGDTRNLSAIAKSKPCHNFNNGNCRFGSSCRFSHEGGHGGGYGGGHSYGGHGGGHRQGGRQGNNRRGGGHKGGYRSYGGHAGPRDGDDHVMGSVVQHSLAAEDLKVYLENRVNPKMQVRKREVFKKLLEIGNKGSSWRCVDARVPEIVAFGGSHLNKMVLAIVGSSQNRPNTLYVFFFNTNIGKQETELNRLKTVKSQKGPGGFFTSVHSAMKGMSDIKNITFKKTTEEKEEEEEAKRAIIQAEYDATHSVEALDAQVAALALEAAKQKEKRRNGEFEDDDSEEEDEDFGDLDALF